MPTRRSWRLAAVVLVALAAAARAEDQRIAGSKLVLRKNATEEHLVLLARDGVVAPLPGGAEDPTFVGAVLEISNPRTGERARFDTDAADWTVNAVGTVFRFRNSRTKGPGSEVRALVIRHRHRLKISARALGITLDEEAQHALAVVLTTGTRRYCLLFGGTIGKDRPGRFAARNAPAPNACAAPVVLATTTTTTTTRRPSPTTTSTKAPTVPTTTSSAPPPTTTSSTSTTSSSSSTAPPSTPTTTSTQPPPTTSTRPPTTSTSSSSTVSTTSSTTSTAKPCSFRGNACKGWCPSGSRCDGTLFLCTCVPDDD